MASIQELNSERKAEILAALQPRFEANMLRHPGTEWSEIEAKLKADPSKLWSVSEMERTDGEPDVVVLSGELWFVDFAAESPKGRRSLCYDRAALDARKENKPAGNAVEMAASMGIELLNAEQYRELQEVGEFDLKTSSWLSTPARIRELGGAIFGDRRYETVFVFHNGADSYYASRAFRGGFRI